jgi:hypothetical protein
MATNNYGIVVEMDAATNTITERNLTLQEIAELKKLDLEDQAVKAEAQAKADARESALAKLAALGLTQDEINAL